MDDAAQQVGGFQIRAVQFGQQLRETDGTITFAPADIVEAAFILDGRCLAAAQLTPEQALEAGRRLTAAATALINAEITDTGKPAPFLHRLARLTGKPAATRTSE